MKLSKLFAYFFLSLCLLNLQVGSSFSGYVSFTNTYAAGEENTTSTQDADAGCMYRGRMVTPCPESNETASKESDSSGVEGAISGAADSVNTQSFKGEDAESAGIFMQVLTMLIIGFVTASFLIKCSLKSIPMDVIVAAIAGVVYILAEVMELFQSKEEGSSREITYKINSFGAIDDDVQKDAIIEERKNYQSVKDSAEKKAKFQKGASAAFYAAGVVSLGLYLYMQTTLVTCAEIIASEALLTFGAASACLAGVYELEADQIALIPKPTMISHATELASGVTADVCCGGLVSAQVEQTVASCSPVTAAYNSHQNHFYTPMMGITLNAHATIQRQSIDPDFFNKMVDEIVSVLVPKAEASMGTLLGGLGGGMAVAYLFKKKMDVIFDNFLGVPLMRGVLFGVLGVLAGKAAKNSEDIASTMQRNIDKLDEIIARFDAYQETVDVTGIPDDLENVPLPLTPLPNVAIGTAQNPFPCAVKTATGECGSVTALVNNKIKKDKLVFDPLTGGIIQTASRIADGTSGQTEISSSTQGEIESLASNQQAAKGRLRKMQDLVNKNLKNSGKKGIDFDKRGKDLLKGVTAKLSRSLRDKGLSARGILSTLGKSSGALAVVDKAGSNGKVEEVASPTMDGSSGMKSGNNSGAANSGFRFDIGGDEKITALGGQNMRPAGSLENMNVDLNGQDINNDTSADIFKIISVRYLKSYRRIFEKSEPKKALEEDVR